MRDRPIIIAGIGPGVARSAMAAIAAAELTPPVIVESRMPETAYFDDFSNWPMDVPSLRTYEPEEKWRGFAGAKSPPKHKRKAQSRARAITRKHR